MHQIIGKAVVIIDQGDHRRASDAGRSAKLGRIVQWKARNVTDLG
jgi:hypothetical protein